jgi:hypothetical protein
MKKHLKVRKTFAMRFLLAVLVLGWPVLGSAQLNPGKRIIIIPNPEPPPLKGVPAQFGRSVAAFKTATGELIIIAGATEDLVDGVSAGAVHLIDGETGDLIHTIPNPAPALGDQFGWSVAVHPGGNIIVGARLDDDPDGPGPIPEVTNSGAVFVFDINGNLVDRIPNPYPNVGDLFGKEVTSDQYGNIIVSAMRDDDPDGPGPLQPIKDVGAVFVFDGVTGNLLFPIPSVFYQPWDWFGMDVTALNDKIFVADPYYRIDGTYGGAIRVFDAANGDLLDTWANPHPPTNGSWDMFGARLAVDELRGEIINGALADSDPDGPGTIPEVFESGAVFVHNAETGTILHTIPNPFPYVGDYFGQTVAAAGGKYVIGAMNDDDPDGDGLISPVVDAGAVFVYDAETGAIIHTIPNPFPDVGDRFGGSIAIVDENIIVGAVLDDDPDGPGPYQTIVNAGSVFVFDVETGEERITVQSPGGLVPATEDRFGIAIAMSSSRIVAGAPQDALDPDGPGGTYPIIGAGSVYVFDKHGRFQTTIWNPFPGIGDNFGASVAIVDENIIVGAPSDDDPDGSGPIPEVVNSGSVFVFDKNGNLLHIIRDPFPGIGDNFGASVAVDKYGNIIVGVPSDDDPDGPGPYEPIINAGAVFIFDSETGEHLNTIENPAPGSPDSFGFSIAVDKKGNIIVGAVNDGDPDGPGPVPFAAEAGAAFVFDGMTGELLHRLYDPNREPIDQFGASVAVDKKGKILVGATNKPGGGGGGVVFIFDPTTGTLLNTITNPAPETGDGFGRSIVAEGRKYFIGAPWDSDPDGPGPIPEVTGAGAVFVFDSKTAELLQTIVNPAPEIGDRFGLSIAAQDEQYVIGAPYDDDPDGPGPIPEAWDAGAVFLFHVDDDNDNGNNLKSVDVDQKESIVKVETYPNPVSDILTIESNTSQPMTIQITSINGQLVYNGLMDGSILELDLSSYNKGVYFITIKSNDFTTIKKIIKL